jgi:hypothetical protein
VTEVMNGRKTGEPADLGASDEELIRQLTERAQADGLQLRICATSMTLDFRAFRDVAG